MDLKDVFIILLIIVIIGSILFGSIGNFLGSVVGVLNGVNNVVQDSEGYVYEGGPISTSQSANSKVSNVNSSTSDNNIVSQSGGGSSSSIASSSSSSDASKSSLPSKSSSTVTYEDYQKDYETGMVDVEGNPIYLSIVSTSGGQMEPGIYQVYWSALGPINQTRIG